MIPDPEGDAQLDVDVVVCCYTVNRWADIVAGVGAVARQSRPPRTIVVVVDHNDDLLDRCTRELPALAPGVPLTVLANHGERGLSGARNTAVDWSTASLVAFLDDDAEPEPTWLERLCEPFAAADVWVTGGRADPAWPVCRPAWFPPEFDWVIGCSYRGMPVRRADVRNVHGATMVFRHAVFDRVGGFVEGVGRVDTVPLGGEETELCIRLQAAEPSARIVYVPDSVVRHRVSDDRVRPRYFFARCWAEGLSKAAIGRLVGAQAATATERDYVRRTLRRAVTRELLVALGGRPSAAARAGAVVAGLAVTAAGYLVGDVRARARLRRGRA
jgi:GT2 family glycosyltransferase